MDDLRFSEVQIIVKNREQTKNIQWDYSGKYTSEKRNELLNIGEKKKERKILNPAVLRRIG